MRILLQQKETGLYFKAPAAWTPQASEATDFLCSTRAIEFCQAHKITGVQLVLKFEEQVFDIVLPMAADRHHHGLKSSPAA